MVDTLVYPTLNNSTSANEANILFSQWSNVEMVDNAEAAVGWISNPGGEKVAPAE